MQTRIVIQGTAVIALAALMQPAAMAEGLLSTKRLSASLAGEAVMAAVQDCLKRNYSVGAVIVDYSGVQQAALRGDGASGQNMLNAIDKAFTAATFGEDTAEIVKRQQAGGSVSSSFSKVPHLLLASGGVVIKVGNEVIGALGVSGATGGDNDAVCAKAGLDKIRDRMK
ncbi:MAG: hypothetical protein QOI12_2643 [Alphaproteobacteria bacterium]|jgi:uncharacterized protein GlcG (DUF336 family)|nr:hypothetical protein [Alphaproteobacteria bacterium]